MKKIILSVAATITLVAGSGAAVACTTTFVCVAGQIGGIPISGCGATISCNPR
jgi:hypothetical protein